jgi:hypothetical protein
MDSQLGANPGFNLIKLFWHKSDNAFCKLDHFINVAIIFCVSKKSKIYAEKSVMRLTPGPAQCYKTFLPVNYGFT